MHGSAKRVLCALLVLAAVPVANAGTCFVTMAGSNANNGASWASPYDLQTALGASACTEIWVAAGIYKPTSGSDRTISFGIRPGVAVYGGFAGTEANRGVRDPAANPTVLSGDLLGDDTDVDAGNGVDATVSANNADNSYTIVVMNGTGTPITATTVLDGFTITGGNANGTTAAQQAGSGLYCNGQGGNCSPTLNNLVFSGNTAASGGAVYADGSSGTSSPSLTNSAFSGNSATGFGGAFYSYGFSGASNPVLANVTFSANTAGAGGGAVTSVRSNPALTNVTFRGNSAFAAGGAIYLSTANAALTNVILQDDTATTTNSEIAFDTGGTATLDHGLVWSSGTNSGACPLGATCTNMLYADPMLGALQANGGITPTFLPGTGSAAIDNGKDAGCPATDQRGLPRPQGMHCDIGAVEVLQACFVDSAAAGANTGRSWTDAFTDLQSALATPGCSEIWVAKGVYKPTAGADQTISFAIPSGTAVYGGFAGNETQRNASNPRQNPTVLSGDLGGNDTGAENGIDTTVPSDGTNGDNSYHVVYFDGRTTPVTAATVLDGFVITAGFANGGFPDDSGGGAICNANHAVSGLCSPALSRLVFSGNFAGSGIGGGGALYNDGYNGVASPTLTDIAFSGNAAGDTMAGTGAGGAMRNDSYGSGSASSPTLNNVTFSGNTAGVGGGAMYNSANSFGISTPVLTNVTFSANASGNVGGAISNSNASPKMTNVSFSGNSALYYGGAMSNSSSTSKPILTNVILWNDSVTDPGGGDPEIFNQSGQPTIDHSIVKGGCSSGSTCTNLVTGDPKLGALAYNGGFTPTFLPGAGSAAIDTGKDVGSPATDQRGIARPQGAHCDIGAVEVVAYDRIFADNFDGTPTP
jgi:predicted outer membrane repeat protein